MRKLCRYCGDPVRTWSCKRCPELNTSSHCKTCHNELKHGRITNQNIKFIGGTQPKGTAGVDGDPDAFMRSGQ